MEQFKLREQNKHLGMKGQQLKCKGKSQKPEAQNNLCFSLGRRSHASEQLFACYCMADNRDK